MKVYINLSCEFEELPNLIREHLGLRPARDLKKMVDSLDKIRFAGDDAYSAMELLEWLDDTRVSLYELDQKFSEYSTILSDYVKAQADIKSGVQPKTVGEVPGEHELPEISQDDVVEEEESND